MLARVKPVSSQGWSRTQWVHVWDRWVSCGPLKLPGSDTLSMVAPEQDPQVFLHKCEVLALEI